MLIFQKRFSYSLSAHESCAYEAEELFDISQLRALAVAWLFQCCCVGLFLCPFRPWVQVICWGLMLMLLVLIQVPGYRVLGCGALVSLVGCIALGLERSSIESGWMLSRFV